MRGRLHGRQYLDTDVLTAARGRISHAFDLFDHIVVSFSGGKDSTVVLDLAYAEAQRRGQRLRVVHCDEEAIPYQVEEYVRRVAAWPGVDLEWYCVPVKHRNACSPKEPWWYPWAPESEALWVRPLPPEAITDHPAVTVWPIEARVTFPDLGPKLCPPKLGRVGMLMGIRAGESITRHRAVTWRRDENWIMEPAGGPNYYKCYPIFDWSAEDVWAGIRDEGWDYCEAYDLMEMAGVSARDSRLAPPFGEEPIGGLWQFSVAFPELWEKMVDRVAGAATAARYARTELYSFGRAQAKPTEMSWPDFITDRIAKWSDPEKAQVAGQVKKWIRWHYRKTRDPIMPTAEHPLTAVSWEFLLKVAVRGDFKNRAQPALDPKVAAERAESWQEEYDALSSSGRLWEVALEERDPTKETKH